MTANSVTSTQTSSFRTPGRCAVIKSPSSVRRTQTGKPRSSALRARSRRHKPGLRGCAAFETGGLASDSDGFVDAPGTGVSLPEVNAIVVPPYTRHVHHAIFTSIFKALRLARCDISMVAVRPASPAPHHPAPYNSPAPYRDESAASRIISTIASSTSRAIERIPFQHLRRPGVGSVGAIHRNPARQRRRNGGIGFQYTLCLQRTTDLINSAIHFEVHALFL